MDDENGTGLPPSIELAWGLRERPAKGPKPGLSLERIVAAAVRIAVSDGLAAVSMGRVAAELGAAPMSLYRHVAAKDELLALMVDAAGGSPPTDLLAAGDWRSGLARWAGAYRAVLRRHPWILRIPVGGPPNTPNQVAWLEAGLRALRDTGLAEGEKLGTILLLSGFVRNEAALVADLDAAVLATDAADGALMPDYGRLLARLTDATTFPALHAAIAAGVFDAVDAPDAEFEFGLGRLLDGIDALVRERA